MLCSVQGTYLSLLGLSDLGTFCIVTSSDSGSLVAQKMPLLSSGKEKLPKAFFEQLDSDLMTVHDRD